MTGAVDMAGSKHSKKLTVEEVHRGIDERIEQAEQTWKQAKRVQLNVIVTAATKALIERLAAETGRSQGQVAELLIEKAITYDQTVAAMNRSLEDIQRGNVEAALQRMGHIPVRSPHGKIWLPPNYPVAHRSGFVPWDEGEFEAVQATRENLERAKQEAREKGEPK
jgi:hypothetical protein